jgi:hypothetical protein
MLRDYTTKKAHEIYPSPDRTVSSFSTSLELWLWPTVVQAAREIQTPIKKKKIIFIIIIIVI